MIKIVALLFCCNMIVIDFIHAQKCYVCESNVCQLPTKADVKVCSENEDVGSNGKKFVAGALGKSSNEIYDFPSKDLSTYVSSINLNESFVKWTNLAKWACYVTKDKHRGCFMAPKGVCAGPKGLLSTVTDLGNKLADMIKKVATATEAMFSGISDPSINKAQKTNVSDWLAQNYMTKLVNNSNGVQFQLDQCCEGDECNLGSMVQTSITVFSVALLSIFILV